MAELLPISPSLSPERRLDVVFVHGLGGDPITTWRSGDDESTSWPHWLAEEFGTKIGVWSLGYTASPTRWRRFRRPFSSGQDPEAGTAMSLVRRTRNALDRLVLEKIGQRPVCFITHSLGGLLAKSILRAAAYSMDAPDQLQVVERCRGVLFLATPHHGSWLANVAEDIKLYRPSVSTKDLKADDDHLLDLYEWYRDYANRHNILTRSYFENLETSPVGDVVSRSSADPGVSGPSAYPPVALGRNHLEICKPLNKGDQAYLGSKEMIKRILEEASTQPTPAHPSPTEQQQAPPTPAAQSTVLVRSFLAAGDDNADTLIDLTDLFLCADARDRRPKHADVWSQELPGRLAEAAATIQRLPRPVVLAAQTHLSIAWYLGTLLHPKRGVPILLRQRQRNSQDELWDPSEPRLPSGGAAWTFDRIDQGEGTDLAVVVSVTHNALPDAQDAIRALGLSVRETLHARFPNPNQASILDGGHARWLADALTTTLQDEVVRLRPTRLHLFATCPSSLAFLLGQDADRLGPTTVYEFAFGAATRNYTPGLATGP